MNVLEKSTWPLTDIGECIEDHRLIGNANFPQRDTIIVKGNGSVMHTGRSWRLLKMPFPNRRDINCGYLIIGHTCLMPEFHFFLEGKGLKRLASQLREGEDAMITVGECKDKKGNSHHCTKIEAIDTHNKYSKEKPA